MTKFTYDDVVTTIDGSPLELRPGKRAWIVAVLEKRLGEYFDRFPAGIVYTIEFEDGSAVEVHESQLKLFE
jgi:hypothetical protein